MRVLHAGGPSGVADGSMDESSEAALALTVESHSVPVRATPTIFVWGVLLGGAVGVLAGLVPAWQASRREIAACFRAV